VKGHPGFHASQSHADDAKAKKRCYDNSSIARGLGMLCVYHALTRFSVMTVHGQRKAGEHVESAAAQALRAAAGRNGEADGALAGVHLNA
jgi:hypothetical protein